MCVQCGEYIPTRVTIDGKKYSLRNRKNCLGCVPFNQPSQSGKQYSQWSEERKARHRSVAAAKGLKRKKLIVEYKGGKCLLCHYDKCLRALTFHHRNPA